MEIVFVIPPERKHLEIKFSSESFCLMNKKNLQKNQKKNILSDFEGCLKKTQFSSCLELFTLQCAIYTNSMCILLSNHQYFKSENIKVWKPLKIITLEYLAATASGKIT